MKNRGKSASLQIVRYGDSDTPWVEVVGDLSSAQQRKLERIGFSRVKEGRSWAYLDAFGRRNASARRVEEVLSAQGIVANVVEYVSESSVDESVESDGVDVIGASGQESEFDEKIARIWNALDAFCAYMERFDVRIKSLQDGILAVQQHARRRHYESERRILALGERIAVLNRQLACLADERHPEAGREILVKQPPERFRSAGREVVLDVARNIPVAALPEEDVRQRTLRHLMEYLGYPSSVLGSEWALRRRFADSADRADILIMWARDSGGDELEFAAVVECKRPGWPLNDDVWDQVTRYAAKVGARVAAITDGELLLTRVRTEGEKYLPVDRFPAFHSLQMGRLPPEVYEVSRGIRRPTYDDLIEGEWSIEYDEIAASGPGDADMQRCISYVNIASLLMDSSDVALPRSLGDGWKLTRDRGLIDTNFGNAGYTSHAYAGLYRGLILEDPDGGTVLPLLRVWSAQYGERGPPTPILAVAFHRVDERKRNHALQLNLAKHLLVKEERVHVVHDGRIALGEGGAISGADTRRFIASVMPEVLRDDQIEFGSLPNNRLIHWDDFLPIAVRLIRYALACENVRTQARKSRK